jgi:hypothetical protein
MAIQEAPLAFAELASRLDGEGIVWAVFAGAAAAAYGATRALTDVDILVRASHGERLARLFPEATVARRKDGVVKAMGLPGFDLVTGLRWRDDSGTYTLDLDARMETRLTRHEVSALKAPVIPPEDNILLKALWGRGPDVGKHDWEDVQAMMANLPNLNWEYLRWRAERCGPRQRTRQVVRQLETLWHQTRGASDRSS